MDLSHRFTVPTSVEDTWAHFNDIASVAECFPGAQVTSVDGDSFSGSVKVKLGPIALVYNGSGHFVEKDEEAHRFVVEAKGKDKRGNGTAGATVTLTMAGSDTGTDVEVLTDLAITGKPAQFGRGVMQDVSDKLLGQFVACLETRLGESSEPEAEPEPVPAAEVAPATGDTATAPVGGAGPDGASADAGARVDPTPSGTTSTSTPPRPAPARPAPARPAPPPQDDALDLGAAVLPVLARTYRKQALGAAVVVGVIVWAVRR